MVGCGWMFPLDTKHNFTSALLLGHMVGKIPVAGSHILTQTDGPEGFPLQGGFCHPPCTGTPFLQEEGEYPQADEESTAQVS